MKAKGFLTLSLILSFPVFSACSSFKEQIVNSQAMTDHLQIISAGHTGCMPKDNVIEIIHIGNNNEGIWTASCQGKRYLCSSAGGLEGQSNSCAPAVK
ncbi:hypothetical protein [Microbulbifer hainanensis]|uniref:hypothetical protein n=1 Tax=Microbulbifer hainanensis TaxID=2735675 RepID=UPI00186837C8|nr:hypothetical protein [Microbulbifer hainanensis]